MTDGGEPPVELGQKPTVSKQFEDISAAHQRARETSEAAIDEIAHDGNPTPPSIRGPLRSGKTALQYHMFCYAWDQGVPALYVEASALLAQFEDVEGPSFGDWVEKKAQSQVESLEAGELETVDWLPNDRIGTLQEWHEGISATTTDRVVLLIDEVEQNYTEFLTATGVDDSNPLRVLLDKGGLFPVLSMGQISAMQFVGFADMKRTDPVSIPPVTISHIRALLEDRGLDPGLDRVVFWLTRGRAAHVHQVITDAARNQISFEDQDGLSRWLAGLADEKSAEFRTVRRVWEHTDVDDPGSAAAAVAFDSDGDSEWLVESENWLPADDLIDIIETIVRETDAFTTQDPQADATLEARQLIREGIERVVDGIAVGPTMGPSDTDSAVPTGWLTGPQDDRSEGRAFLSLAQDILLAFEAERPARDIAFDALEDAKAEFKHQYDTKVATIAADTGDAWTLRPSLLERTYPPLATDPSRLTGQQTDDLLEAWDTEGKGGLKLSVDEQATVYACPTEASLRVQIKQLAPDPTHPVVMLVDDSVDTEAVLDSVPLGQALENYNVLSIVPVPTARVWTFVVQLEALLSELLDASMATEEQIDALLSEELRREQRTTIETLYTQLKDRVAGEAAEKGVEAHRQQYVTEDHYVWSHPTLADTSFLSPRGGWTNGRHSVLGLLAIGSEPDWDEPHGRLLANIKDGINEDVISIKNWFDYKELLNNINKDGTYGKSIHDLRRVCRDDADTGPTGAVMRAMNAFEAITKASEFDHQSLLSGLYDQEGTRKDSKADRVRGYVKSLSPTETDDTTDDILWALVTASLARNDDSYVKETLADIETTFNDHVQTLDGYLSDVDRAEELLIPGEADESGTSGTISSEFDMLSENLEQQSGAETIEDRTDADQTETQRALGVTLDTSHITTYRENLVAVRDAVRNMKQSVTKMDFRPTGYAFAVLAARYEGVVCDAVHELEQGTPNDGNLSGVKNLSSSVKDLQTLLDSEDVEMSTSEQAGVDAFVEDILDFQPIVGKRISVGDPNGEAMSKIREADRAARARTAQVEDMVGNLEELVDLQKTAERRLVNTHRELKALVTQLTHPDAKIDEESSPSAEKLLSDGQGDATDPDEQQADMTDTETTEDTE